MDRSVSSRRALIALLLGCVGSVTRLSRADTEPIRLQYYELPGCPTAEQFSALVLERARRARLASADEPARTFVVSVQHVGNALTGSLVIRERDGATAARTVSGTECAQVAKALALAVALAIDPAAEPVESGAGEASSNESAEPAGAEPALAPKAGSSSRESMFPQSTPRPATSAANVWQLSVGPSAAAGIGPRFSVGGTALIEWHRAAGNGAISALGVEATALDTLTTHVQTAAASLQFFWLKPQACSLELALAEQLSLAPCLGTEVGLVTGGATGIAQPKHQTRFWVAAEAFARLRFDLDRRWVLELDASALFPITRYRFLFLDPDTPVHAVPVLGSAVSVKLGAWLR